MTLYNCLLFGGSNYQSIYLFVFTIMYGIPIAMSFLGIIFLIRGDKKNAKRVFIFGGIYLLISLGVCGGLKS